MVTTSNIAAKHVTRLNDLCMAGKLHEAQKLAIELDELMTAPFLDTGPIPIKCMMKLMGLIPTNEHRLPMMPATPELEKQLEAVVHATALLWIELKCPRLGDDSQLQLTSALGHFETKLEIRLRCIFGLLYMRELTCWYCTVPSLIHASWPARADKAHDACGHWRWQRPVLYRAPAAQHSSAAKSSFDRLQEK
jgi:Dihydrodipicolinate synthetase family